MKKLLLSLGALSAVVAPVAAVVACGSHHAEKVKAGTPAVTPAGTTTGTTTGTTAGTTTGTPAQPEATTQPEAPKTDAEVKSELKDMVADILTRTSYVMDGAEQNKLVEELFKLDGSKELATLEILAGKLQDNTHGADDFMVLIGGAPVEDMTNVDGISIDGNNIWHANPAISSEKGKIGDVIDESTATDLEARWGETEAKVKDANFVLYLQYNETTGDVTVQLSKVVTFSDAHFELAAELPSIKASAQNKDYNNEFALDEFIATHA